MYKDEVEELNVHQRKLSALIEKTQLMTTLAEDIVSASVTVSDRFFGTAPSPVSDRIQSPDDVSGHLALLDHAIDMVGEELAKLQAFVAQLGKV